MSAYRIGPIRETAHRILIEMHIAEGNTACAVKRCKEYQLLLRRELEVEPSPLMTRPVQHLTSA
ncbi:BTAD domain-containing putative transcriptional regulator [Streptomyces sp. NPDC002138]|uniref:BTAD domain-containing putative transcriptional regulator n=1 Tax=Streptomyces sp. NPDC002138 TaxID=3154410 RepID=UPI00331C9CE3